MVIKVTVLTVLNDEKAISLKRNKARFSHAPNPKKKKSLPTYFLIGLSTLT